MKSVLKLLVLSLFVCTVISVEEVEAIPAIPIDVDEKVDPIIISPTSSIEGEEENMEIQLESQMQEELNEQLPQWINEELQQTQNVLDLPITESFSFQLSSEDEVIFKWNPSKEKELKLIVNVLYLASNGDVEAIKDAEETEYIEVTAKNPKTVFFGLIGKVYRSKVITMDFDTDYKEIKFYNKNSERVLVTIDVEKLDFVVEKGVPDDKLSTTRNKMELILQQSESTEIRREHLYKWQWGYFDNERNHDVQVLGLTGVELFCILMTACVQMYCLKGLLDNRAVV